MTCLFALSFFGSSSADVSLSRDALDQREDSPELALELMEIINACPELDVNAPDFAGRTLLDFTVENQKYHFFRSLTAGMKAELGPHRLLLPSARFKTISFLKQATAQDVVRLVQAGLEVNSLETLQGESLLILLRDDISADVAAVLVNAGAKIDGADDRGNTLLIHRIIEGDYRSVKILLSLGADPDKTNTDGETPLFIALSAPSKPTVQNSANSSGRNLDTSSSDAAKLKIVKSLIAAGAVLDARDRGSNTALMKASWKGGLEIVNALIAAGAHLDLKNDKNCTALILAAQNGHFGVAKALIEAGADVNIKTKYGNTALLRAVGNNHARVVALLIDSKADVNARNNDGYTALIYAAQSGCINILSTLLAFGVQIDARTKQGDTALLRAAFEGQVDIFEALITAGADKKAANNCKDTALTLAAIRGHSQIVDLLVKDAGASELDTANNDGFTALTLAAQQGHLLVVKSLIAAGANVNSRTKYLNSPLMKAVGNGHGEIVQALLSAGADLNLQNREGDTALMFAAVKGLSSIAIWLLTSGADVNARTANGDTALTLAIRRGHSDIVEMLISAGADLTSKNVDRALDISAPSSRDEIRELVEQARPKPTIADLTSRSCAIQ